MSKTIVEIQGIKMEVDLSTARRIDEFRIGDNVKILKKTYSGYDVLAGVIAEFVQFKALPTIVIATFKQDYSGCQLDFLYYNSETKDVEIAPCLEHEMKLEKGRVVDKFAVEIEKKQHEMADLIAKRDYFVKYFAKYFEDAVDEQD